MADIKILEDIGSVIEKELKRSAEKGTLNPAEMDAVNKAVNALEKIEKVKSIHEEREYREKHPDNYSGAFYNIRNFPQFPSLNMDQRAPMSYNSYGWYDGMASGERGRSQDTGRFVSRETHHDNYSGHSINDRMVDTLEHMMDTATSEFERQQILDKIKMIRNSPDVLPTIR